MRERLCLPGRSYILSLGTLEPRKNLPRLLEAWSRACSLLPADTWLVLGGNPAAGENLEK